MTSRSLMPVIGSILLAALTPLTLSSPAHADLMATFSGTLTEVPKEAQALFTVGDTYSGTYIFDETTPGSGPAPAGIRHYPQAISSYQVTTSGGYGATATTGVITVINDIGSGDAYGASGLFATGASLGGVPLFSINVGVGDASGAALASNDLPPSVDLNDFPQSEFNFTFTTDPDKNDSGRAEVIVRGQVETLSFGPVLPVESGTWGSVKALYDW